LNSKKRLVSENIECVDLSEIRFSRKNKVSVQRDATQIEQMRRQLERGRPSMRVVLRLRKEGFYTIEDGRHRILAAIEAGEQYVDAVVKAS